MLSTWPELGSQIEKVFALCGSALHYAGWLILTGEVWFLPGTGDTVES